MIQDLRKRMEAKIWEDATNGNQGPRRSKEQTEMNNTLDDSISQ